MLDRQASYVVGCEVELTSLSIVIATSQRLLSEMRVYGKDERVMGLARDASRRLDELCDILEDFGKVKYRATPAEKREAAKLKAVARKKTA